MNLTLRVVLSLLLAAAVLVPLAMWGDIGLEDVRATASRMTWRTYWTAFGLHVGLYVLRAVRFRILIPPPTRPEPAPFLAVCAAHTLASFVLPAKIGEASFVIYAQRITRTPAAEAIASLVVSRLLDTAVLALGLGLACLALHASGGYRDITWFLSVGCVLIVIAATVFALSSRGDLLVEFGLRFARLLGVERTSIGARILAKTSTLGASLRAAGGEGRLVSAALISIPVWLVIFLFCDVLARGLGLPQETTLAEATFGSGLAILTSLIPISAFANFGTLEMGWVLGFGVLGVPHDLAATTGFGLHVVQLVNVVALGVCGHVGMALAKRDDRA